MIKPITEMCPAEYWAFMAGRGQKVPEKSTTQKHEKQSKAAAFFSQPYQTILKYKQEHPAEYNELQRQIDAERNGEEIPKPQAKEPEVKKESSKDRLEKFSYVFGNYIHEGMELKEVLEISSEVNLGYSRDEICKFYSQIRG